MSSTLLCCPTCEYPMRQVNRDGYFCRSCLTALTLMDDDWAHVQAADFVGRKIRVGSLRRTSHPMPHGQMSR